MRKVININKGWLFSKDCSLDKKVLPLENYENIDLPHTWNATDGQDGGADYYRGTCLYFKKFSREELLENECCYLEIRGANSSSVVYLNGEELFKHDGGYSTFRVDLTSKIADENILVISVDNSENNYVYPQTADFTFYGGLYRDVNLIFTSKKHFDLDYYGTPGIKVTPVIEGKDATIEIETYVDDDNPTIKYELFDLEGNKICEEKGGKKISLKIQNVHLWHGRKDPYLYRVEAKLLQGNKILDNVQTRFGCRTFKIDPENGFILNGEEYPLRGVSRHQDRLGKGNAISKEDHEEDMDLILEVGATTIRLAHYQHDQYFYDLCDEKGLVVWAEIPYISNHLVNGRENNIIQMKELITQNYNHPSIIVWGLSNEITISGSNEDLLENHKILNDLAHEMDKTRLTTMAIVSMCSIDDPYIKIPDVVSWNHYFGWYGGEMDMNGPWFDNFHAKHPSIPVGCSEYGCEALNWHNSEPSQGDYSEEYQALYHESLIKQFFTRKYLWATHVWNMFDFGADARQEGGENGQNHKGLVTFDRKYKKDSFYAYKAWLSKDPFVHICSKRYVDRVEDVTEVKVYSNLEEVELFVNGISIGKKKADDHFFRFEVKNVGESKIEAVSGKYKDESVIRKVDVFNETYRLKEEGQIINWFEITTKEGRLSIKDKIGDIMKTISGKLIL
ncbi:MAG: glycoside hydrolase family 2 TIM barrel-domain containing protein, partial [Bacilli bacterium]|nr:glycoside hydrolase family 2 TIM barrel-domain containing protein [Bacilli bacterium]